MRKYNIILIVSAVALLFFGVYTYFYKGLNVEAQTPLSSSISSQSGATPLESITSDNEISADTAFLLTLTSLTKIKIDTSLFGNVAFQRLNDNTVNLEQVEAGRPNPFAPISNITSDAQAQISPVTTNQPVKITAKTAALSGTISDPSIASSTYFEYGPTPTLGKVTPQATPSLIGTYVTTITGLTSQTTYFYRAVAKIRGTPLYGEVISFVTQ